MTTAIKELREREEVKDFYFPERRAFFNSRKNALSAFTVATSGAPAVALLRKKCINGKRIFNLKYKMAF